MIPADAYLRHAAPYGTDVSKKAMTAERFFQLALEAGIVGRLLHVVERAQRAGALAVGGQPEPDKMITGACATALARRRSSSSKPSTRGILMSSRIKSMPPATMAWQASSPSREVLMLT